MKLVINREILISHLLGPCMNSAREHLQIKQEEFEEAKKKEVYHKLVFGLYYKEKAHGEFSLWRYEDEVFTAERKVRSTREMADRLKTLHGVEEVDIEYDELRKYALEEEISRLMVVNMEAKNLKPWLQSRGQLSDADDYEGEEEPKEQIEITKEVYDLWRDEVNQGTCVIGLGEWYLDNRETLEG